MINEGVEKIILNTSVFKDINLISDIAKKFGSQSIVISCDVRKIENEYKLFSHNGKKYQNIKIETYLNNIQDEGAGEIMLTSIDHEGRKEGLDFEMYKYLDKFIRLPVIANGGVGKLSHIIDYFDNFSGSAISCGSLFVFFGLRNAVLINYPEKKEIEKLMNRYE